MLSKEYGIQIVTRGTNRVEVCLIKFKSKFYISKDKVINSITITEEIKKRKVLVTFDNQKEFSHHINSYLSFEKETLRILDYGGGDGSISYGIACEIIDKFKFIEILVVDFAKETINSTNSNINISKINPVEFIEFEEKFDLILASAVLEHIFFVGELFDKIINNLVKGGFIYIRTPYILPIYKTLLKLNIKIDTLFPEHIHDFSKYFFENIPNISKGNNLRIIVSQPSFFENNFSLHFIKSLLSRIVRFPYNINRKYPFVGGWEVIYKKLE